MIESDFLKENVQLLDSLKKIPTLRPFSNKELSGLLRMSKLRKYDAGEQIIEEGRIDTWIYFLVQGKVRIVKDGRELAVLKRRGEIFGEMGVIDGSARSASVFAVGKSVCLATDTNRIGQLTDDAKLAFCYVLYRILAEVLAARLRLTNEQLLASSGFSFSKLWARLRTSAGF